MTLKSIMLKNTIKTLKNKKNPLDFINFKLKKPTKWKRLEKIITKLKFKNKLKYKRNRETVKMPLNSKKINYNKLINKNNFNLQLSQLSSNLQQIFFYDFYSFFSFENLTKMSIVEFLNENKLNRYCESNRKFDITFAFGKETSLKYSLESVENEVRFIVENNGKIILDEFEDNFKYLKTNRLYTISQLIPCFHLRIKDDEIFKYAAYLLLKRYYLKTIILITYNNYKIVSKNEKTYIDIVKTQTEIKDKIFHLTLLKRFKKYLKKPQIELKKHLFPYLTEKEVQIFLEYNSNKIVKLLMHFFHNRSKTDYMKSHSKCGELDDFVSEYFIEQSQIFDYKNDLLNYQKYIGCYLKAPFALNKHFKPGKDMFENERVNFDNNVSYVIQNSYLKHSHVGISIRYKKNYSYCVFYHIPDVTAYIEINSVLFHAIMHRLTSVNFPDNMDLNLFPEEIMNKLMLKKGQKNLVLTLKMTYNKNGKLIYKKFHPGTISNIEFISSSKINSIFSSWAKNSPFNQTQSDFKNFAKLCALLTKKRKKANGWTFCTESKKEREILSEKSLLDFYDQSPVGKDSFSFFDISRAILNELTIEVGTFVCYYLNPQKYKSALKKANNPLNKNFSRFLSNNKYFVSENLAFPHYNFVNGVSLINKKSLTNFLYIQINSPMHRGLDFLFNFMVKYKMKKMDLGIYSDLIYCNYKKLYRNSYYKEMIAEKNIDSILLNKLLNHTKSMAFLFVLIKKQKQFSILKNIKYGWTIYVKHNDCIINQFNLFTQFWFQITKIYLDNIVEMNLLLYEIPLKKTKNKKKENDILTTNLEKYAHKHFGIKPFLDKRIKLI